MATKPSPRTSSTSVLKGIVVGFAALAAVFFLAGCHGATSTTASHASAPAKPSVDPKQEYLNLLHNKAHIQGSDAKLLGNGYAYCGQLDNGSDPQRMFMTQIVAHLGEGPNSRAATEYWLTLGAAAKFLCPEHYNAVVAAVKAIDAWSHTPATSEAPAPQTRIPDTTPDIPDVKVTFPTETQTTTETEVPTTTETPESTDIMHHPDDPWVQGQREQCRQTLPADQC